MNHQDFYEQEYPSEETFDAIRKWPHTDFPALMKFVAAEWKWGGLDLRPSLIEPLFDKSYEDDGCWWCGATGGWSGNEDLIAALAGNPMFWALCWRASVRGGYHEFHVRPLDKPHG